MMSNLPTPAYDVATQFRGGVLLVKIHVVQQGDTLWNIAKKYGVDFEQLKQINNHLANPDQLTPGMKIKIPQSPVHPKKSLTGGGSGKEQPVPKEQVKPKPEKKPSKKEEPVKPIDEKEEAPKKQDHELLKALIKSCAPYVLYKLLKEEKPEVINQIKIEIGLENTAKTEQSTQIGPMPYLPYHKPVQPAPAPPPKKEPAPIKKPTPPTAPYAPGCSEKGWKVAPPPKPKQWAPYPTQPHMPSPGYGYGKNMYQPWPMTPCGPHPMPYQGPMYGPMYGSMYGSMPNTGQPYVPAPHGPTGTYHPSTWGTGPHHIPSPGIHHRDEVQTEYQTENDVQSNDIRTNDIQSNDVQPDNGEENE